MIQLNRAQSEEGMLADLAPDLTPMLDIIFILLVFFMLTAGVAYQSLNVKLPENVDEDLEALAETPQLLLEIRESDFALNGTSITSFEILRSELKNYVGQNPGEDVVIAGDRSVAIERLLRVLTFLQSEGIPTANILMKSEQEK